MDDLRSLIHEEIRRALFGQPIPEKGEKGFKSYKHDLETVLVRASHYNEACNVYERAILEISSLLDMESISIEEKNRQIKQAISTCEREIRKLNSEWRQDNKNLRQTSE